MNETGLFAGMNGGSQSHPPAAAVEARRDGEAPFIGNMPDRLGRIADKGRRNLSSKTIHSPIGTLRTDQRH
ncbi:hypothetical protein AvCA_04170 [Azotobacter vinelandii CA]|uniref:Uncharacterized protein n=2 Tax=Azotobacter vinelandii TaxID=354 RepID=C1DJ90_AZOVD|nr:hypothetical protein Avin_04170 [Azotobacter vinelandii DJ]AGK17309.1 hypothetical protein AvCA_04170 [Azotobacter vinelandii CA]AGK19284.1 hypothetical protein AvCA6_04170 [Azotobacter vinelandii CA6]GLK58849.1 hypothetical protein GCM10017624_10060 [Azotobacter vinelandii]